MKKLIEGVKRGMKKYMLLERLELTALGLADICHVILTTPHISIGVADKKLRALERERNRSAMDAEKRRQIASWLSRLKQNGLVERKGLLWAVTKIGHYELDRLRHRMGLIATYAHPVKSDIIKIISFDIPEKMRNHRNWLRFALKNLGFTMLHKSVWLGKVQIPHAFITELKMRTLTHYVEILGITKTGTVQKELYNNKNTIE